MALPERRWTTYAVAYLLILSALALLVDAFRSRSSAAPPESDGPVVVAAPPRGAPPQAESEPEPDPVATPAEANYFGNTNTYKFHRKTCRYAGCKNCTAKFATPEEAIAAGYRPCGACDP